jgi:hypothetical protein
MFRGHLDYLQRSSLGGRVNTKLGDHGTPNTHTRWFILSYHVYGPTWIDICWNSIRWERSHMWLHITLEGLWTHYMILEVSWDNLNLCTLSFRLSQRHGHGAWLVCEVALSECKVHVKSTWIPMTSNGSCFMVTWTIIQKPPLGGRPNTKFGDHGTPESHTC